jgi:hypothetical protein
VEYTTGVVEVLRPHGNALAHAAAHPDVQLRPFVTTDHRVRHAAGDAVYLGQARPLAVYAQHTELRDHRQLYHAREASRARQAHRAGSERDHADWLHRVVGAPSGVRGGPAPWTPSASSAPVPSTATHAAPIPTHMSTVPAGRAPHAATTTTAAAYAWARQTDDLSGLTAVGAFGGREKAEALAFYPAVYVYALVMANMAGSSKERLMVIDHAERRRCFQGRPCPSRTAATQPPGRPAC